MNSSELVIVIDDSLKENEIVCSPKSNVVNILLNNVVKNNAETVVRVVNKNRIVNTEIKKPEIVTAKPNIGNTVVDNEYNARNITKTVVSNTDKNELLEKFFDELRSNGIRVQPNLFIKLYRKYNINKYAAHNVVLSELKRRGFLTARGKEFNKKNYSNMFYNRGITLSNGWF